MAIGQSLRAAGLWPAAMLRGEARNHERYFAHHHCRDAGRRYRDRAAARTHVRAGPLCQNGLSAARAGVAYASTLSFTARTGTLLVGSVRLSPIRIGETKALLLGPLTVEPAFRERGVGLALIERALKEAAANGHKLVILVGDEPYYGKAASSRCRPAAPSCLDRSIWRGFWSPSSARRLRWRVRSDPTRLLRCTSAAFARPGAGKAAEQQQ